MSAVPRLGNFAKLSSDRQALVPYPLLSLVLFLNSASHQIRNIFHTNGEGEVLSTVPGSLHTWESLSCLLFPQGSAQLAARYTAGMHKGQVC